MTRPTWLFIGGAAAFVLLASRQLGAQTPDANADDGSDDDMTSTGVSAATRDLAIAIAHAEGFSVPGSIPQRANNPGDLVIPGWTGAKLGDQGISVFSSATEGWNRLYQQLARMASGRSHVYTPDMTFAEIGEKWTATHSDDWVDNVVEYLQSKGYAVTDQTTLEEYLS